MRGFASDALGARWPAASYWHLGDVTWMLYRDVDGPVDGIRLWSDVHGVAGFAWFYEPIFVTRYENHRIRVRDLEQLARSPPDIARGRGSSPT